MYHLHPDITITRRKSVHLVTDAAGNMQFTASKITEVLAWLVEMGKESIMLHGLGDSLYRLDLIPVLALVHDARPSDTEPAP